MSTELFNVDPDNFHVSALRITVSYVQVNLAPNFKLKSKATAKFLLYKEERAQVRIKISIV